MSANNTPLTAAVAEHPFPEYQAWWAMGDTFIRFISRAILLHWAAGPGTDGTLEGVKHFVDEYVEVVYARRARQNLVEDFVGGIWSEPIQSGEFDALSYAFFRSAFEWLANQHGTDGPALAVERRRLTKRVGQTFYDLLHHHLDLKLPAGLDDAQAFQQLQQCIRRVGEFMVAQRYLRDHFGFSFSVNVEHATQQIRQSEEGFLGALHGNGVAFALYEMGYPVILPSAVYLYNTIGEAQHHSSRTIEELFGRVGYTARETADFNPSGFPSDSVVELWEIQRPP